MRVHPGAQLAGLLARAAPLAEQELRREEQAGAVEHLPRLLHERAQAAPQARQHDGRDEGVLPLLLLVELRRRRPGEERGEQQPAADGGMMAMHRRVLSSLASCA